MEKARGDGKPHSAQDTLPFRQMYPDGLCKLDDTTWSRCIEFEDVNYQLAQPDDQTAIFEALCDLYNSHDSSIGMEISLPCRHMNQEDFVKRIEIAAQGDRFDSIRDLYTQMLRRQLERGNNGLVKTKLLILTIEEKDIRAARARFSRILLDALNHFKVMGALAKALDGKEWLALLHGILHPDGERFSFDWDWQAPSGLHVKDFIAPSSFRFGNARRFQMGTKFCAASFLQITAPEMDDRILAELLDTESDILLSIHIRSMDQTEAIKTVKRKITDIDSMKIDAQKRAVREGFDMDIIPTDKSFAAKREILNVFLVTKDDILICDPESEYFPLVHRLGGQVIRLTPSGSGGGKTYYLNPMDINLNYSEDDNPLALKSDFRVL